MEIRRKKNDRDHLLVVFKSTHIKTGVEFLAKINIEESVLYKDSIISLLSPLFCAFALWTPLELTKYCLLPRFSGLSAKFYIGTQFFHFNLYFINLKSYSKVVSVVWPIWRGSVSIMKSIDLESEICMSHSNYVLRINYLFSIEDKPGF